MIDLCKNRAVRRSILFLVVAALMAALPGSPAAAAGKLAKLDTSLKLIPADAAFYSSMLRNREQFDAVANSRAWAKLKSMPMVQMGLLMYQMQAANPESPVGKFQAALKNPEIKKATDVLRDMVSHEVFIYGDESFIGFMELMQQLAGGMRYGPAMVELTGQADELDENQRLAAILLATLSENPDLLRVPNLIVGFKLDDTAAAAELLAKYEAALIAAVEAQPETKGRLKKSKIGGVDYLVLTLDGRMLPWDELPLKRLEEVESESVQAKKLIAWLKKAEFKAALGIRGKYLLLAVGSSTDCLAELGKGKLLADAPEMAPLDKFADRRLTSIGYVSRPMMSRLANNKRDIDDLLDMVNQFVAEAEQLEADQKKRIKKDAAALAEDVKTMIPDQGAVSAVGFLNERGLEGYQYDFTEYAQLDGSKPLGLLSHVGGNPFLGAVGRGKYSPGDYDLLVKWAKIAYGYFDEFALPEMSERERKQAKKFVEATRPLLKRVDKANREMLIPALADGQIGFVVDTKLTSKQFHQEMPKTEKEMPMFEPALVLGVSDAKLLRRACAEYQAVAEQLVEVLRKMEDAEVPENFVLPKPQVSKSKGATIATYPLPKEWGLDPKIVFSFGVSKTVAAMTLSTDHTQRLLKATPLAVGGLLGDSKRPLATAVFFDWAGLVEAAEPWVDMALEKAGNEDAAVKAQVNAGLDLLKVLRTITVESYFEDDALVTHSLVELRDIEE